MDFGPDSTPKSTAEAVQLAFTLITRAGLAQKHAGRRLLYQPFGHQHTQQLRFPTQTATLRLPKHEQKNHKNSYIFLLLYIQLS